MTTVIGIDFGLVRIGLAVGYKKENMALPLYVVKNDHQIFETIKNVYQEYDASLMVLGLPVNLDGSDSDMLENVKSFAEKCQRFFSCKIDYFDERLSSKQVSRQLSQIGMNQKKQRGKIDAHAAALILQGYLNSL